MPHVDKHAPGSFCWIELATTDQTAAKAFYTGLFDWTVAEFPMGPGQIYTIFKKPAGDAASAYAMRPEERAQIPPHWNLYVAVENADEAAKKVTELGGKVIEGPFDVSTFGRMAVIQDPTGAYLCVWQAKQSAGISGTWRAGNVLLGRPEHSRSRPCTDLLRSSVRLETRPQRERFERLSPHQEWR
jgi:predicted enzyme related to lactoylglutathione lyase